LDSRLVAFARPAGAPDGSGSTFRASADGTARYHAIQEGECPSDRARWMVVLDYHQDGKSFGPRARPLTGETEQAAQLGFLFAFEEPVFVAAP
jgi:hypothetical protein